MTKSKPAAIYCRISQDSEGLALGVARQEEDCRALAEREGLTVTEVFTDNDRGASTRSRKRRPRYAEMMERAHRGEFGAIIAYSNSRLTRRPMEWDELITLAEHQAVRVLTIASGRVDLSTADGRAVARTIAAWDAAEAERTAERVARKHLENARNGKPVGGTRPFGWEDDKRTVREHEAALIRRAATDVIDGVPIRAIVREWNEAGVKSSRGAAWSPQTVRQMLRSPRLAGWRVHQGRTATDAHGNPVRGQWEPILDDTTHRRVLAALAKPETRYRVPRRGARHYLLTGIVRCGVCNGPMYGNRYAEGRHYYICQAGDHGNSVSGHGTDEAITELVLAKLAADEVEPVEVEWPGEARLEDVRQQIADLMAAFVGRRLSEAVVFPAVEALEAERDALLAERSEWAAATIGPEVGPMSRDEWDARDVDRRRAVVERLLDAVLIRPATTKGNRLDLSRIVPVPRGTT